MIPEHRAKLEDLRQRAENADGAQCTLEVNGWSFILDHGGAGPGKHLSARLVPVGRGSTDEDWKFLGTATEILGVPEHDQENGALLTPFATTDPNAVHHWHWDAPLAIVEGMRAILNAPEVKARVKELHQATPPRRSASIGRNDPCPCNSGKKYKHCCINKPVNLPCVECSRASTGAYECRHCGKRHAFCAQHQQQVQIQQRGHVFRVHPEKIPRKEFANMVNSKTVMDGLLEQRAMAPELWAHFFEYLEEFRRQEGPPKAN